jgi:hypothetical protein
LSYAVVASGPLIIVYANGQEVGRVSDSSLGAGGMSLQVLAHGRGQAPAALRIDTLDIYEAPTAR